MSMVEAIRKETVSEAVFEAVYSCGPGDAPCLILADLLDDMGRAGEAELLRAGRPVMLGPDRVSLVPATLPVRYYPEATGEATGDPFADLGPMCVGTLAEVGGVAVLITPDGRAVTAGELPGVVLINHGGVTGVGQLTSLAGRQGWMIVD